VTHSRRVSPATSARPWCYHHAVTRSHPYTRWIATFAILCWFLFLPLRDIVTFPERLSVLPNLETDAAAYDAFAWALAQTWDIWTLPSKHPPGWMVVLAGVYALFGHSYVAGKLVSWLALVLTTALCGWLAHRVYGRSAAVVAALLCASSPGLRGYVGTLQYEVFTGAVFALFLTLSVRLVASTDRDAVVRRAVLAGLAGGLLVLTRETFVLVVPITAVWVWTRLPTTRADRWLGAMLLVAIAALPALAWSAVQSVHHQRLIVLAEKGPIVFELGNNPLANGTYNEPLVGMGAPAGVAFIRAFPLQALRLAGRKVLYSFGVLRDGWNVPHPAAVWIWRATTGALPLRVIEPVVAGGWLLLACIVAAVLGVQEQRRWWVLPATAMAILAVHIVTLASYRFTVPLLPILYVIASGPLARLGHALGPALRTPIAAGAIGVLLVAGIAAPFRTWPLRATFAAAELEGVSAMNVVDPAGGAVTRVADAERGQRPVAVLPDHYWPKGSLRLTVVMRSLEDTTAHSTPVARVALTQLSGRTACVADIAGAQIASDAVTEIIVLCDLDEDGPATLAVWSLGQVDLSISDVKLAWVNQRR
jgi:4-amino-4-deoxy-L-arabinose transferase-like glycosyltransferase